MNLAKIILVLAIIFGSIILAFRILYKPSKEEHPQFGCGNCDRDAETRDTTGYAKKYPGKNLFKNNCSACHYASSLRSTGPGLQGVLSRIPSLEWAHDFIHNADSVMARGDAYAIKTFDENGKAKQPHFPDLTDKEIDEILMYVDFGPEFRKPKPSKPVAN